MDISQYSDSQLIKAGWTQSDIDLHRPPEYSLARAARILLSQEVAKIQSLPKVDSGVIFVFCPTIWIDNYHEPKTSESAEWRSRWTLPNKVFKELKNILKRDLAEVLEDYDIPTFLDYDSRGFTDHRENYFGKCDWYFGTGEKKHPKQLSVYQISDKGSLVLCKAKIHTVEVYNDDNVDEDGNHQVLENPDGWRVTATGMTLVERTELTGPQGINGFFIFKSKRWKNHYTRQDEHR